MENKSILVLHSGGLDSTLLYQMAKKEASNVKAVYFDIGHDYAWKEKQSLPSEVEVIDVSWFQAEGQGKDGNTMGSIFIPGRNLLFIVMAACKFLPDEIWLGALMGELHDSATDKNIKFQQECTNLLQYVLRPFKPNIRVVYPAVERQMGKLELTRWGIENGLSKLIEKSSSCMTGSTKQPCGYCGVCLRRAGIFHQLNLHEEYSIDNPFEDSRNFPMIVELLKADIERKYSHYDKYRIEEIVPALEDFYRMTKEELLEKYESQ